MDKRHLDILKPMDLLYEDCLDKSKDDGVWRVRVIAPCSLSQEEWDLCFKYHSTIDGHTGGKRLQRLTSTREGTEVPLAKCREFTRLCSDCQKNSVRWLKAERSVVIDSRLLCTVVIDTYFAGDGDPNYRGPKSAYLSTADCTSRVVELVRVRDLSATSTVTGTMKAHTLTPLLSVLWMSDRGTHFMAEAKELLVKLVGGRLQVNYAGSHQSQATLERIHEEVSRHLRPLLSCLWRVLEGDSEQLVDAGVYMAAGTYSRVPRSSLGYSCPVEVFSPLAEVSVGTVSEPADIHSEFDHEFISRLLELHQALLQETLVVMQQVGRDCTDEREAGPRSQLDVGDLCLVRYDPAPGAGRPFKEAFRSHGPYSTVGRAGDFFRPQTTTGLAKLMDIHISRVQPFRWDRKNLRTPVEVASDAERTSVVLSTTSWSTTAAPGENLPRSKLRFEVELTDGTWSSTTYDMTKSVDVFRDWVSGEARAPVRETTRRRPSRPSQRYARQTKVVAGPVSPSITVGWIAKPQDSLMTEPGGTGLDGTDFKTKQLLVSRLSGATTFSDGPRRVQQCKDGTMEYTDILTETGPSDFVKVPPTTLTVKKDSDVVGKPKFLKAQPVRGLKEQASTDKFLEKLGPKGQGRPEETPPGESVYSTPTFIKHESLDKDRMLHSSRHTSDLVEGTSFYMALTVRDIFESLAFCLCATMLDLQASFYQFLASAEFRSLTALTDYATGRQCRLRCMGMGLKSSPATMQQLMQEVFPDEVPYTDSLGFGTKGPVSEAWPLQRVRSGKNFAICRKPGLKLSLRKCTFLCGKVDQSVECLGRHISSEWHSTDDKTAEKVRSMKRPTSTKEPGGSLCRLSWPRPYVEKFGQVAAPLYHFTSAILDKKKTTWSDEVVPTSAKQIGSSVLTEVSHWRDLLSACASPDLLYYYKEGKNLFACGDASSLGWGLTVLQLLRDDLDFSDETLDLEGAPLQKYLLVSIGSGSFSKEQRKWTTTDQECCAFYKGTLDSKHLLLSRPFFMTTDHKSLPFLVDSLSDRVVRYKVALQAFTIHWIHAPGSSRALFGPDALSRS